MNPEIKVNSVKEPYILNYMSGYIGQANYGVGNRTGTDYDEDYENDASVDFSRYFFIDYENVNRDGLNGILKLSEEDSVRIYYSDAADTMTFGLHRRIMDSHADFTYVKVQVPIKNAVDCQILFDLRDLIKDDRTAEYYIVSKDTDFDKAIENYQRTGLKVKRILEIAKRNEPLPEKQDVKTQNAAPAQPTAPKAKVQPTQSTAQKAKAQTENQLKQQKKAEKEKREAQVRTFFGQNFKEKVYKEHKEEIIQAVLTCKTRQEVNNALMKIYPGERVSVIYKTLQPLIKDYPGK